MGTPWLTQRQICQFPRLLRLHDAHYDDDTYADVRHIVLDGSEIRLWTEQWTSDEDAIFHILEQTQIDLFYARY